MKTKELEYENKGIRIWNQKNWIWKKELDYKKEIEHEHKRTRTCKQKN